MRPAWINLPKFSTYHFYTNIYSSYAYFFPSGLWNRGDFYSRSMSLPPVHISTSNFQEPRFIDYSLLQILFLILTWELRVFFIFFLFLRGYFFPLTFGVSRRVGSGEERENHRGKRHTLIICHPWCPDRTRDRTWDFLVLWSTEQNQLRPDSVLCHTQVRSRYKEVFVEYNRVVKNLESGIKVLFELIKNNLISLSFLICKID